MLKNMKIGMRLGLGFGLIAILLAIVGFVSYTRIGKIDEAITKVVQDRMPKVEWSNQWIDDVNTIARILRNAVILSDPAQIQKEDARIQESRDDMDKVVDSLENTIKSEEGIRVLKEATSMRADVRSMQEQIREFAKQNKDAEAAELLFGDYRKLQAEYLKAIYGLIEFQTKLAEEDGAGAGKLADDTLSQIQILLIVSLLLAVFLAWFITRSITRPINQCMDVANKVAAGDTNVTITVDSTDETGLLLGTMKRMVETLNSLVNQMKHMADEHNKGDIDVQVESAKFEGAFKVMAQGVNDMVNGHIAVKKKAMACVAEFGKGNFDAELEKFPGKKVFINNTIEGVRTNLKNVSKELGELIEASKAGQLTKRGNEKAFMGDWSAMILGVNQILDAILLPIQEAAQVLDKVAARDLTARVLGNYQGDHTKIKNSLNLAVENLDTALGQVTDATGQVASASQQISAGSQSLAQGANEQASSLEEVSSSLEEMASMTKQNADNAIQAKGLAADANDSAKVGTEAMNRMSSAINRIKESSDQTAKIVKTIDEIAMQTNLLALNAAVEAARAGEAGRGFAVVAEEVRNLAQRSAQAAKNTADMIGESVKNADDGVKIAVEVSKSFEMIATGAKKVNDLIGEIAAASKEQSTGIEQVTTAVSQMDKVTQQNAANSEESASAAEELSSQAEELQAMVGQFHLSMVSKSNRPQAMISHNKRPAGAALPPPKASFKPTKRAVAPEEVIPLDDDNLKEF